MLGSLTFHAWRWAENKVDMTARCQKMARQTFGRTFFWEWYLFLSLSLFSGSREFSQCNGWGRLESYSDLLSCWVHGVSRWLRGTSQPTESAEDTKGEARNTNVLDRSCSFTAGVMKSYLVSFDTDVLACFGLFFFVGHCWTQQINARAIQKLSNHSLFCTVRAYTHI